MIILIPYVNNMEANLHSACGMASWAPLERRRKKKEQGYLYMAENLWDAGG